VTGPVPATAALAGARVVVTRAREQASELVDRLTALGAVVVELPVIRIGDPDDHGRALAAAADRLAAGGYRWVACTSSTAATRLLGALGGRPIPPRVHWAAVGPGTARVLTEGGFPPDLVPETSVAEALAAAFPAPEAPGPDATVLFPRAAVVRGDLAEGVRQKGWRVDEVVAYRTEAGEPDPGAVAAAAVATAVAFTSSSTVDRTVELLGPGRVPPVVVTIGPVTTEAARRAGLEVAAEASPHSLVGLVAALAGALAAHHPGQ
jgi:uroporphyrinogen-III synthase